MYDILVSMQFRAFGTKKGRNVAVKADWIKSLVLTKDEKESLFSDIFL